MDCSVQRFFFCPWYNGLFCERACVLWCQLLNVRGCVKHPEFSLGTESFHWIQWNWRIEPSRSVLCEWPVIALLIAKHILPNATNKDMSNNFRFYNLLILFFLFKVNSLTISGVSYGHITGKPNIWFWKWGRVRLTVAFAKTWWTWGNKLVLLARMWSGAAKALSVRTVEVIMESNGPRFGWSLLNLARAHFVLIDAFRQMTLFHVSVYPDCCLAD